MNKIRWIVILIAGLLASCDEQISSSQDKELEESRPVKSLVVSNSGSVFKRSYPAIVLPAKQAILSFRASGQLIELPVRAAQTVSKGDLIAKLDPRDFQAEVNRLGSQLDQAKAKLTEMQIGARSEDVATLEASVDAAKSQFKTAELQADRTQQLFQRGIVTKARLDQDLTALEVAEAQLRSAEEELKKGKAGAREIEVAQQKAVIRGYETQLTAAEDALRDATLRAPFSGIIAKTEIDNFANVQAKETIAILQQIGTVDLIYDVPSSDILQLSSRQDSLASLAQLDNMPGTDFTVKFVEFSTQADPDTQTFRARVSIKPPKDSVILPGMSGRILIEDKKNDPDRFKIPAVAIDSEPNGEPFVWIVGKSDNKLSKRSVSIAEASGQDIIVTKGLQNGDTIVIAGLSSLREKMAVRPVNKIGN